jgi:cytochrome bd-type quinol oxidase subunit 2
MQICSALLPIAVIGATAIVSRAVQGHVIACSREGAVLALNHLADWAKWMTGLETAAFGALTLLVFGTDGTPGHSLTELQTALGWLAFVLLATALIVSGWVLAAFPSLAIRLHKNPFLAGPQSEFDVLEQPIFGKRSPRLGFMVTWHHWLWGLGLLSLGAFALSLLSGRCPVSTP